MAGHPDAVRHVSVSNAANYQKIKYVDKLKPILGDGLVTSNGNVWSSTRKVVQHQMTMPSIHEAIGEIDRVIWSEFDTWRGKDFDVATASSALTLRVLCSTMFGNSDRESVDRIVSAMHALQWYFSDVCWSVIDKHRLFRTKLYKQYLAAREDVFAVVRDMIAERRRSEPRNDMLQALIDAVEIDTGEPLSDQRVLDEVVTALIAGHETTGNTLSFAWDMLAKDPALQERLRQEAYRCIPLDRAPTAGDLRGMTLIGAFIKEVERLYPAVWWVARTALADDELMGVHVRKGDVVMITPYITHRVPEFWNDPERFDPERFVDYQPTHKFAFIPFSSGPRVCPGVHMATIEMQIAIARLLQRKQLKGDRPVEVEGLITLRSKGGMPLDIADATKIVTVSDVMPGQHALVDTYARMRTAVFVEEMGWPLEVDAEGRELDQFDNRDAEYSMIVADGKIKSYGRLLPCRGASLLFDVYNDLIDDSSNIDRDQVWEGTRLGTARDVSPKERGFWLRMLIQDASARALAKGVKNFCSVSDLGMERVLHRAGIRTERLGSLKTDQHGFSVLALKLDCNMSGEIAKPIENYDEVARSNQLIA